MGRALRRRAACNQSHAPNHPPALLQTMSEICGNRCGTKTCSDSMLNASTAQKLAAPRRGRRYNGTAAKAKPNGRNAMMLSIKSRQLPNE